MKASELILELQKAVSEHGDLDILFRDVEEGVDWENCIVWPDPASPMEAAEGITGTIDINVFVKWSA